MTVDKVLGYTQKNAKDIMAVGFKPEKTFIFSNFAFVGYGLVIVTEELS